MATPPDAGGLKCEHHVRFFAFQFVRFSHALDALHIVVDESLWWEPSSVAATIASSALQKKWSCKLEEEMTIVIGVEA
ncbi:hypothetical protein AAE478_002633 [Parahypoxylon ruwenzoriense]